MTDEEKAEEYYEDNECYSYLSELEDFEAVFDFVKDRVKQAYLDGLEEGRKEKCFEQNKDGTIRPCEVMKENEELEEIRGQQARIINNDTIRIERLKAQIEKMKCCGNCKKQNSCIKHNNFIYPEMTDPINYGCNNLDKWELAE